MKTLEIPVNRGKVCLIDEADLELFKLCKFSANECRSVWRMAGRFKGKIIYLHRVIMNPPDGKFVDHINGNGLDNRRANLRICSHAENIRNSQKQSGTKKSKFKGVGVYSNGTWRAQIGKLGKQYHLGTFKEEILAAKAYDKAAAEMFGEFARLNFPKEYSPSIDLIKENIHHGNQH